MHSHCVKPGQLADGHWGDLGPNSARCVACDMEPAEEEVILGHQLWVLASQTIHCGYDKKQGEKDMINK